MPSTCFICHSSADATECAKLADCLESRGWECWIAPRDIPVGSNYPHEIVEGIKRCDSFLILLTNQAAVSPHILRELELACGQGKRIIPLRLPGVELGNSMEYLLASVQWIEVTAGELFSNPQAVADRVIRGSGARLGKRPPGQVGLKPIFGLVVALLLCAAMGYGVWRFMNRAPAGTQVREVVKVVQKDPPAPAPPKVVIVKDVAVNGDWNCIVSSGYEIEWSLRMETKAGRITATGPKSKVNGKKANSTESKTVLRLDGDVSGDRWKGEYVEDAVVKQFRGTFDVRFAPDFKSFEGTLMDGKKEASARFSGTSR